MQHTSSDAVSSKCAAPSRRRARLALLVASTALVLVAPHPAAAGSFITGDTTLNGDVNGDGGSGYIVQSGTLTINTGTVAGFVSTGGAGSGGGAGFGGAILVNSGGTVVLNNVNFSNNTAAGGTGGIGNTGGSLNDMFNAGTTAAAGADGVSPVVNTTVDPSGQPGSSGLTGGAGNGGMGGTGGSGGNGTAGGHINPSLIELVTVDGVHVTADAANIVYSNATITYDTATSTDDAAHIEDEAARIVNDDAQAASEETVISDNALIEAADAAQATEEGVKVGADTAGVASDVAAEAEFTDAAIATADAVENGIQDVADAGVLAEDTAEAAAVGDQIVAEGVAAAADDTIAVADTVEQEADIAKEAADGEKEAADGEQLSSQVQALAGDTVALQIDTQALAQWDQALANGQLGIGGGGGNGGVGGTGDFGYGGGEGGTGGTGGQGGYNWSGAAVHGGAIGGNGGSGGSGGDGGFGAGGGTGGDGGAGGLGGVSYRASGQQGSGGGGGAGGFGAGSGSSGNGFDSEAGGGGGGSGYGGSIFVNTGGTLEIDGSASFNDDNVVGGASANGGAAGAAAGSDLFMMSGANVTLAPGAGDSIVFNGSIADDSAASIADYQVATGQGAGLTVDGDPTGLVMFNNIDTYSGQTKLVSGVLQAQDGTGIDANSNIDFAGGMLQSSGVFKRFLGTASNDVQWSGTGNGGFAGVGGGLTVALNNGAGLLWGHNNFVTGTDPALDFGSTTATDDVTFTNAINLAGADATVAVTANAADDDFAIMSGVLSNGSLTAGDATHTGVLMLTAQNSFAGGSTVQDGTLAIGAGGALNAAGAVAVEGGAGFDVSEGGAQTIGALTGAGHVALGANTLTLNLSGPSTFSGTITDGGLGGGLGGGLNVTGGETTLTGINSYTGATTIAANAGLALAGAGGIAGSDNVIDNGVFDVSAATGGGAAISGLSGNGTVALGTNTLGLTDAAQTFAGSIGGAGNLVVAAGTETLTGVNAYTGATQIDANATLALAGNGSIGTAADLIDAGGTFDISSANGGANISGIAGDGAVVLGANRLTLTNAGDGYAGDISGTGGLTVAAGEELLDGVNDYTGTTTIAAGASLDLAGGGSIVGSADVADAGLFDISGSTQGAAITGLSGNGAVALGANTLTLTDAADVFDGAINGAGGLTVAGGAETLTSVNGFAGIAGIAPGATLALSGPGSIAAAGGVADDGAFDISNADAGASIATLHGNGAVALGANTLTLTAAADAFAGDIAGSGGLTVAGGAETLQAAQTYTGATIVDPAAALLLAGAGGVAASSGVQADGLFDISGAANGGATIATLSGNGTAALGGNTLTLANANTAFNGAITGAGNLLVAAGTQTLTGQNVYTGATGIAPGATLALTGSASIQPSREVVDDGTFDISGEAAGGSTIQDLSGNGAVNLGNDTLDIVDETGRFTGVLQGTGGLDILGGAFVVPNQAGGATYQGTLGVQGSTLAVSAASVGGLTGPIALNNGTVVATAPLTLDQNLLIQGSSTLDAPDGGGIAPDAATALTLTGNISGPGMLATNGDIIDDGSGGPGGGTDINSGVFEVGDAANADTVLTGHVTVGPNSTLRGHGTIVGNIANGGTVFPGGSIGTLTVNGNYSQTPAGKLMIEVTPSPATAGVTYDRLAVTGRAALAGALALQVDPSNTAYTVGNVYRGIVTGQGGVTGRFAAVTGNQIVADYLTLQPGYTATAVNLTVTASPLAYSSGRSVLDNEFVENNTLFGAMSTILDSPPQQNGGAGARDGAWAVADGGIGHANGTGISDYNVLVGNGIRVSPHVVLGFAYARLDTRTGEDGLQTVKGASNGFYGYGIYQLGRFQVDGTFGGGSTQLDTSRSLAPTALAASGSQSESFYSGQLRAQLLLPMGRAYLLPFGSAGFTHTSRGSFTEGGAGTLDIAYGARRGGVGAFGAGLRVGYVGTAAGLTIAPWVEAGGTVFTGDRNVSSTETIGSIAATETAQAAPKAAARFGAGVTFNGHGGWSGSLGYQGQFASNSHASLFSATLTYRW